MEIEIIKNKGIRIAEIISDKIEIKNVQDALDVMADCDYQGARNIIVHKKNLAPGFFDLSTGLAGEVFQKFSNYRVRLAIVGDFSAYKSKSLQDFMYESNIMGRIIFIRSKEEALDRLSH